MPIINGEKFACDSCVKGHRVSNCNHTDRPLNHIAPKGRPIKQCEHCRVARKSKSHHAKCDCGIKREKKVESKNEDLGCSCHNGSKCTCSNKSEASESRLDKILQRTTQPVKSKPHLAGSNSETTLTQFVNGHHKPVHRNNNMAHTSGAPYKLPRPHTLHGASSFAQAEKGDLKDTFLRSATDDMFLLQTSGHFYSSSTSRANSHESLDLPGADPKEYATFDFTDNYSTQRNRSPNELSDSLGESTEFSWLDTSLSTVAEDPFTLSSTSPTFPSHTDWTIPSAETDFFSPSDLPLLTTQPSSYAQPISHSGESNYQSVPGLTTNSSSGAQSEIGDQFAIEGFWNDNVQLRESSIPPNGAKWMPAVSGSYENTHWPGSSVPAEIDMTNRKVVQNDVYPTSGTAAVVARSLANEAECSSGPPSSTSTTVPTTAEYSSHNTIETENVTEQTIMIPTVDDTSDEWCWPIDNNPPVATGDVAREFGWLLDS